MSLLSLTPSQLKVSLFFAALVWFVSVLKSDFYMMVILPWAAFLLVTSWKRQNPGVAIFEEKAAPTPDAKPEAPRPSEAEAPQA